MQPTWPLHLQRLSGYSEIQLARLATLLLAHHGGAQVLLISSVQFYFKLSCLQFTGPGCRQLGLSTRRRGAQLEYTYPFLRQTESLEKIREYPRLFNIITLILEYTFILLNANTFFQGYHSLESSPTASHHLVTAMTPSPPLH